MMLEVLGAEDWGARAGGFVGLWTDPLYAYALYEPGALVAVALVEGGYPALSGRHPAAAWFERLAHDLTGATALGAADARPAVEQFRGADGQGAWPEFAGASLAGAHQLAVGPVYGAVTEPAHFRFSLLGERILGLQMRLGYQHKGVLGLIRGKSPRLAARFAARVSGDATVAHGLAFAQAAEAALGLTPPPRALRLRGVMAELERIAAHCAAIGAVAGAAGFALAAARFGLHQEAVREAALTAFGHRLMMDAVIPGGVAGDMAAEGAAAIAGALGRLEAELPALERMLLASGLQDRLGVGVVSAGLAVAYGAGGVIGRGSGQAADARRMPGYGPYGDVVLAVPVETAGDAAARLLVMLAELAESARLVRLFLRDLPEGMIALAPPAGRGAGLGVAESCRGAVWWWLSVVGGTIADVFIVDPSARHWPLLEQVAGGGTLSDFSLVQASLNPSGAAVDL